MPKTKKKAAEISRPRRPKTEAELRALIDEVWTLLLEERRIRVEDAKARAAERAKDDISMAELRRIVSGIGKRTGDFMENSGRILERGVLDDMRREKGVGPVKGEILAPLKKRGEYDAAVINGKQTVLVEIKRNLRLKDVRDFMRRRLPRFVEEFPDLAAGRKVYGALAFELDADNGLALELARESGLMLIQVSDRKRMKVLNPDTDALRPFAG